MSRRFQVLLIALSLAFTGFFMVWYKVGVLGIPFLPHEKRSVYKVGAEISFEGMNKPVLVSMALPSLKKVFRYFLKILHHLGLAMQKHRQKQEKEPNGVNVML